MVCAVRTTRARPTSMAGVAGRLPHPTNSETTRTMPTYLFIEWFGPDVEVFVQSRTTRRTPAIGARHPAVYHPSGRQTVSLADRDGRVDDRSETSLLSSMR